MSQTNMKIPVLDSVSEIAHNYKAWLVDIWGVIHNGEQATQSACDALLRYREDGGIVMLISNAPRPSGPVRQQMMDLGVPEGVFDDSITSGDVTRLLLSTHIDKAVFHIGPEQDNSIFDGLGTNLVDLEDSELVLLSGLYDDNTESPEDYRDLLARLNSLELPMICANPDLKVEKGDRVIYCAGAIAKAYEQIGGTVQYAGKPYPPIYELALAQIGKFTGSKVQPSDVLAIGDSLMTDMAGAAGAGLDALFVTSGIHIDKETRSNRTADYSILVNDLFEGLDHKPVAAQAQLTW